MKALFLPVRLCGLAVLSAALLVLGCGTEESPREAVVPAKKVAVSSNINLEVQGEQRRVLVNASVCLREGRLETLLTHKRQPNKAHESVLWADVDARRLHEALVLANATPGSPVTADHPPTGQKIKITLQYEDHGKLVTVPAQSWVRNAETDQEMKHGWVFAGSVLQEDPTDVRRPKQFMAQAEGTLITLVNFDTSLIDVDALSDRSQSLPGFDAFTERIPPLDTKVTVILEPILDNKKGKK
jgi:hypothetical protein